MEDLDALTSKEIFAAEIMRQVGVPPERQTRAMKAGLKAGTACFQAMDASNSEDETAKAGEALDREMEAIIAEEAALARLSVPESQVPRAKAIARLHFMIGMEMAYRQLSPSTEDE